MISSLSKPKLNAFKWDKHEAIEGAPESVTHSDMFGLTMRGFKTWPTVLTDTDPTEICICIVWSVLSLELRQKSMHVLNTSEVVVLTEKLVTTKHILFWSKLELWTKLLWLLTNSVQKIHFQRTLISRFRYLDMYF